MIRDSTGVENGSWCRSPGRERSSHFSLLMLCDSSYAEPFAVTSYKHVKVSGPIATVLPEACRSGSENVCWSGPLASQSGLESESLLLKSLNYNNGQYEKGSLLAILGATYQVRGFSSDWTSVRYELTISHSSHTEQLL